MAEYNDNRFLQLVQELRNVIEELLDMEGNDEQLIRDEVENILGER